MVTLRHRVAKNAGFENYVGYAFKSKLRFDYTPKHCRDFHEACRRHVVPLVAEWDRRRASQLKIPFEQLRPWDLSVDPLGRGPLRPFEGGRELVSKSVAVFQSLDPRLAKMLRLDGRRREHAAPATARASTSTAARARPRADISTTATARASPSSS